MIWPSCIRCCHKQGIFAFSLTQTNSKSEFPHGIYNQSPRFSADMSWWIEFFLHVQKCMVVMALPKKNRPAFIYLGIANAPF